MSQEYFDMTINKIGYAAVQFAKAVKPNQITQEEINSWVVEDE